MSNNAFSFSFSEISAVSSRILEILENMQKITEPFALSTINFNNLLNDETSETGVKTSRTIRATIDNIRDIVKKSTENLKRSSEIFEAQQEDMRNLREELRR